MAGKDFYDDTSIDFPDAHNLRFSCAAFTDSQFKSLKVAIPRQFIQAQGLENEVACVFDKVKNWLVQKGAHVDIVDLPVLDASIACYYVIALSEAASNLSRFDGIRYGKRKDPGEGYDELYVQTRSDGFGAEVKRRIVIGNYVLSEQFSGSCYKKAMSVRAILPACMKIITVLYARPVLLRLLNSGKKSIILWQCIYPICLRFL